MVAAGNTGPTGELQVDVPWPAEPAPITHWIQVLILDPPIPGGYAISNAISVTSQ